MSPESSVRIRRIANELDPDAVGHLEGPWSSLSAHFADDASHSIATFADFDVVVGAVGRPLQSEVNELQGHDLPWNSAKRLIIWRWL